MGTIKDLINRPLLLALVIGGLGYTTLFSVVYLLKARKRALELGITKEEMADIIKSSLIFSIVPLPVHRHRSGHRGKEARLGLDEQLHHGRLHDPWYGLLPAVDRHFLREGG